MKIALITHEPFYPPSGGGSAEAVYLVEEMRRRGHEVHVFCPAFDDSEEIERRFQIQLHLFKTWRMGRYTSLRNLKYLAYPFFIERLVANAARRISFDRIVSQHAISAVAAGRLRNRINVPVVMNFLDYLTGFMETWPAYLAPPPLLSLLKKFELSLPLRYAADGLMTVSDTLADYFERSGYPRGRIRPIYFGFDSELFPFRDAHSAKPSAQPPTVVMHGSLDHHHLREIAFASVRHVAQRMPDLVFKIVGHRTAALEQFLRRTEKLSPRPRMETPGFVPYQKIAEHLSDATVGIVPYEESTGTHCAFVAKIVEYLAVGLPVVSTPLDSARQYFGDEPMVRFSEFNGASFGERILSWLREPSEMRGVQGQAASERVRRELDWRVIGRKAVDFVEQSA